MPDCAHCGREWRYRETLMKSFRMKMVCPYCNGLNYLSAKSRRKSMIPSIILAPAIILFGAFTELSLLWAVLIGLALGIVIIAVTPFFTELSSKEEPLW